MCDPWFSNPWFAKHGRDKHRLLGGPAGTANLDLLGGQGFDLYYHVNQSSHRPPKLKGSRRDITEFRHLLIDLDRKTASSDIALAERWLLELPNICTVVFSGRGVQGLMCFSPHEPTADLERACGEYLHGLRPPEGWLVDPTTYDLARVGRFPGTVNTKNGRRACVAKQRHDEMQVDTAAFVTRWSPGIVYQRKEDIAPIKLNRKWLLSHLNERASAFIFRGAQYPDRHRSAFIAAKDLAELGVAEGDARELVLRGASLCTPKPLDPSDAERTVKRVYQREREEG